MTDLDVLYKIIDTKRMELNSHIKSLAASKTSVYIYEAIALRWVQDIILEMQNGIPTKEPKL